LSLFLVGTALPSVNVCRAEPPYPPSRVITGVDFDFSTHRRFAPGSDNWPITWADDGHMYVAWGDGGGFGGTNSRGRVGVGFGRVEGSYREYAADPQRRMFNIFGGVAAESPHKLFAGSDPDAYYRGTFEGEVRAHGKCRSILSVGRNLYAWLTPLSNRGVYVQARLAWSTDRARSWTLADWVIEGDGGSPPEISSPALIQMGGPGYTQVPAHAVAPGGGHYVYALSIGIKEVAAQAAQKPGALYLFRVPANHDDLLNPARYEWYSSTTATPSWSRHAGDKKPVFQDPNGVASRTVSCCYNPQVGRYILMTEHSDVFQGKWGMFDAAMPWGPWTTIAYYGGESQEGWRGTPSDTPGSRGFFWSLPVKWLGPVSNGKQEFILIFTGGGSGSDDDSWNTLEGVFRVSPS